METRTQPSAALVASERFALMAMKLRIVIESIVHLSISNDYSTLVRICQVFNGGYHKIFIIF